MKCCCGSLRVESHLGMSGLRVKVRRRGRDATSVVASLSSSSSSMPSRPPSIVFSSDFHCLWACEPFTHSQLVLMKWLRLKISQSFVCSVWNCCCEGLCLGFRVSERNVITSVSLPFLVVKCFFTLSSFWEKFKTLHLPAECKIFQAWKYAPLYVSPVENADFWFGIREQTMWHVLHVLCVYTGVWALKWAEGLCRFKLYYQSSVSSI